MTQKRSVAVIQSNCLTNILPLFKDLDITKLEAQRSYEVEKQDNSPSVSWIKAETAGVRNIYVDFDEENDGPFHEDQLRAEALDKFSCTDMTVQKLEFRFQNPDLIEILNDHGMEYWDWEDPQLKDDYNLYAEFTPAMADSQFHDTPEEVHELNEYQIKELGFNASILEMTGFETQIGREYGGREEVAARPRIDTEGGETPARPSMDINGLPREVLNAIPDSRWPEDDRKMIMDGDVHTIPATKVLHQESSDVAEWVAVGSTPT